MTTEQVKLAIENENFNYIIGDHDGAIRLIAKICNILNQNGMNSVLVNYKTFRNYIVNELGVTKENHGDLHFFVTYIVKKYKWLRNFLHTYYVRPDIEFTNRPLLFPEVKKLADLCDVIKCNYETGKGLPEEYKDFIYLGTLRLGDEVKAGLGYTYYAKPKKKLQKAIDKDQLGLIGGIGTLELVASSTGNGVVYGYMHSKKFIGSSLLVQVPLEEVKKELLGAETHLLPLNQK